jgi:hypothetical protein
MNAPKRASSGSGVRWRAAPDETPTPVRKPTIDLWPMYSRMARDVTQACEAEAAARTKAAEETASFTVAERVFQGVPELRALVREARALAATFEAWEHADPGGDLRRQAIAMLLDLRERAKALDVTLST